MTFINHVNFTGPLPGKDARETAISLVTEELEAGRPSYTVSEAGRLLRDNEDGTFTDMNYSGQLFVSTCNHDKDGCWDWWLNFDERGNFIDATEVPDYAYYSEIRSVKYRLE